MHVSFEADDLRLGSEGNRRALLDPATQIARHRVGQPAGSDEQVNVLRRLREKYRSLSSGVTTSDDDDLLAAADLSLHERRAVIDAGALELREEVIVVG